MGCLFRLGCLCLLVILALGAWMSRDRWVPARYRAHAAAQVATAPRATWEPLSPAGAARTTTALARLSQPHGPVFETLSGADVAAYAFGQLTKDLPPSTDSIMARVSGDTVALRANVRVADLSGIGSLGSVVGMLGDRQPVELDGTLSVVHPGLGEFEVYGAHIGTVSVPRAMIARVVANLSHGPRPAGIDAQGLPVTLPTYIGDVRVSNGRVTLYKNVD